MLKDRYPEIAKEWDSDKNGDVSNVTYGSSRMVWWKCVNMHEWKQSVYNRTYSNKRGCKECFALQKMKKYSISNNYPEVAKEWDNDKNDISMTPQNTSYKCRDRVCWKCDKGHTYKMGIRVRIKKDMCPVCKKMENIVVQDEDYSDILKKKGKKNCLAHKYPELVCRWHPTKNDKWTPYNVTCKSHRIIWWKCDNDHVYDMMVFRRTVAKECPYCSGRRATKENCLATKFPKLIKEWDSDKNELTPYDVTPGSSRPIQWKCKHGHRWKACVNNRVYGQGCPCCAGREVCEDNCLATLFPNIAKEWHSTKNGKKTPENVLGGTNDKYWWICDKKHEWEASVSNRTQKGSGCLVCAGHLVCENNCLATKFPELVKEWDNDMNGDMTPYNVTPYSHNYAHWKCNKSHKWEVQIYNRSRGHGCPHCEQKHYSKIAIRWLDEISDTEGIYIQHAENGGEYKIKVGKKRISVDGYCKENNTIYSYFGCYWHSCCHKDCRFHVEKCEDDMNFSCGNTFKKLYKDTKRRTMKLKKLGYNVITIQECEHKKQIKISS